MVRISAVVAPVLLLLYGLLRMVDGLDGSHGPGWAWNAGHVAFFVAFVLFGTLVVGLRRLVPARRRGVATAAAAAGLFGTLCFLWVIAGDLSAEFKGAAPLPEPLQAAGPLLFQLGLLTLMGLLVARPRRLPVWSPLLVFAGFVSIAVNLDLLPVGAVLVAVGLAPLQRSVREAVLQRA